MYPILYLENIYLYQKVTPPLLPQMLKWYFCGFFCRGGGELGRLFVYFIFRGMGWWLRQGTDAGNAYVQCKFIWDLKRQHILLRIENTSIFAEYSMNVIEMSFASNYIYLSHDIRPLYMFGNLFTNIIWGLIHLFLLIVLFGYYHFFPYSLFYNLVQVKI